MQAPKVYVGIHSAIDNPASALISLGTQAAVHGDWVLGPKYPATHAFVVVVAGGLGWRLDGQPKTATWSPCVLGEWKHPTALWQLCLTEDALSKAAATARDITGAKYDWTEIAESAAAAFSILPGMSPLRALVAGATKRDAFHSAMICTRVTQQVLVGCGGPVAEAMGQLEDLFPERLGQVLRGLEASSLVVRVLVTRVARTD